MPRLLRAICVVGLGLCAALPFRRATPRPRVDQDNTAQSQPLLLGETHETVDLSLATGNSPVPTGNNSPRIEVTPIGMSDVAEDEMLPETTTNPEPPPLAVPTDPFPHNPTERFPHNPTERFPKQTDDAVLTHVLTAQDTLRHLAERYLGNSHRWKEILDLNSRLLPNPYQLPVGTRIQIPRQVVVASKEPQIRPQNQSLHLPQTRPARQPTSTADPTQGDAPLVPVVRSPAVLE
ncbi:MAG: hypothetical protein VX346_12845 [Planctomycetota bacterium]|nr:hypothetical protein [Planctomycetota bacterium]